MSTRKAAIIVAAVTAASVAAGAAGHRLWRGTPPAPTPASSFGVPDLAELPRTWYCASPWSAARDDERRGMRYFAWRLFIALNWPGKLGSGSRWVPDKTMDGLNAPATYPRWASWHTPKTVFGPLQDCVKSIEPPAASWAGSVGQHERAQPCVYDQRGEPVHHEIRLAQDGWVERFRGIVCSGGSNASFLYGQCHGRGPGPDDVGAVGALAVKLAWKVLSPEEVRSGRFLQRTARVPAKCPSEGSEEDKTLGLVALHVTQKSNHYGQWIWSTFEHVDNLAAEGAAAASFHDPGCTACLPNTSQKRADGRCRTQITRVRPIPAEVQALNRDARAFLAGQKSVLQHYQLIDVQYVPHSSPADGGPKGPEPAELRNPLVETFRVVGRATPKECLPEADPVSAPSTCIGCHSKARFELSFALEKELCNCDDRARWLPGCAKLGFTCN